MGESAQAPRKHFQIPASKSKKICEIILEGVNEMAVELAQLNTGITIQNIMSQPLIVRTGNAPEIRILGNEDFGDATVISLDLGSKNIIVDVSTLGEIVITPEACCAESETTMTAQEDKLDQDKLQKLQFRVDNILAGIVQVIPSGENNRLFSPFLPSDKTRAAALAALCEKIANRLGGLNGLEAAVDRLYESLGHSPSGMVEYAMKLFLTHHQPARERLQIRSLEERQPGMVKPSKPSSLVPH